MVLFALAAASQLRAEPVSRPPVLALLEAGESAVLRLHIDEPGKTYWRYNEKRSHAPEKFEVEELGVVGDQLRVRITAKLPGIAVLAYDLAQIDDLGTVVAQAEYGLKIDPEEPAAASTKIGGKLDLNLKGTPGAGYTWRLLEAESSGLDNVQIEEKGWAPINIPGLSESLRGAPALFGFELRAVKAGKSRLVFEYVREWETKPGRRQKIIDLTIEE